MIQPLFKVRDDIDRAQFVVLGYVQIGTLRNGLASLGKKFVVAQSVEYDTVPRIGAEHALLVRAKTQESTFHAPITASVVEYAKRQKRPVYVRGDYGYHVKSTGRIFKWNSVGDMVEVK